MEIFYPGEVLGGGGGFEEKQRLEEVQLGGAKGGSAILLSALRAVTDLSGLEGGGEGGLCWAL